MRSVKNALIVGIRMDRGHQTFFDAEGFVQYLGNRCQAVGGTGCIGDDCVFPVIIQVIVNPHNNRDILVGSRGRNDNLPGSSLNVQLGFIPGGKKAGRFQNYIDPVLFPLHFCGVPDCVNPDRLAIDDQAVSCMGNLAGEDAVNRVIFKKMRQGIGTGQIIDRNDINSFVPAHRFQYHSADPAETIDCNP